jgi:hypothetical protein
MRAERREVMHTLIFLCSRGHRCGDVAGNKIVDRILSPATIATSQLARFTFYTIMSLSENPRQTQSELGDASAPHPYTPPSASGTVATGSKLDKAIESACKQLRRGFLPGDDDDWIKINLADAWNKVHSAISQAGGPNLKKRLRNKSEFLAHAKPESNVERELIKLVGSMAKGQVDWGDLFQHGTLLSSL